MVGLEDDEAHITSSEACAFMLCGVGHLNGLDVLVGARHTIDNHGPAREHSVSLRQRHIVLVVLDSQLYDVALRHFHCFSSTMHVVVERHVVTFWWLGRLHRYSERRPRGGRVVEVAGAEAARDTDGTNGPGSRVPPCREGPSRHEMGQRDHLTDSSLGAAALRLHFQKNF